MAHQPVFSARSVRGGLALAAIVAFGWVAGCSDTPTDPGVTPPLVDGLFVSDPGPAMAPGVAPAKVLLPAGAPGDSIVYISIEPGTEPAGVSATLTNLASSGTVSTAMQDGGFDPVAVAARVGDSVEIVVRDGAGTVVTANHTLVAARAAPRVVRTDPPHRKRDVPLNAIIGIVFSEPVQGGSLTPQSVQLFKGTTPIAGTARLLQGTATTVTFAPDRPLEPNADYVLKVTSAVLDLQGDALVAPPAVSFTTGSGFLGQARTVLMLPDTTTLLIGAQLQLSETPYATTDTFPNGPRGAPVPGLPVIWSSDNPTVASVSATGRVSALAEGRATIQAAVHQEPYPTVFGVASVSVSASLTPVWSVEVTPFEATLPTHGTIELTAVARDSIGNVLPFRPVTWGSSNPAVATVAASTRSTARVSTVSPGIVLIIATVEGRTGTDSLSVVSPGPYVSVTASSSGTCGLTSGSWVYCWGGPFLGNGTQIGSPTPVALAGELKWAQVATGQGTHSCAISLAGDAYCWGQNWYGQLGIGNSAGPESCPGPCSSTPVAVVGGLKFATTGVGEYHSCGLTPGGAAYCWGGNNGNGYPGGMLGTGDTASSLVPVPVTGGRTFTRLAVGRGHTCALTAAGAAYCWGARLDGQLGDGGATTPETRLAPVAVAGGVTFTSLSAGFVHTCGLTAFGLAYCWGNNGSGQLGVGTTTGPETCLGGSPCSTTPVPVTTSLRFAAISAGYLHTCALTVAGAAYCWGNNGVGQLGNGSTQSSATPVPVSGGLTFVSLSAGQLHSCGVTVGGVAYCWGYDGQGQLGDGSSTETPVTSPVRVANQP